MKKEFFALLALAMTLAITPAALADSFGYGYDGSSPVFDATLTFTANPVSVGSSVYEITNVSGTIVRAGTDITTPVSFNVPVIADPNGLGYGTYVIGSTGYEFQYDNQLTPSKEPTLDIYGVLFDVQGLYFNLYWENGAYQWGDSGNYINISNAADPIVDPPVTAAPEPGSLLLFGSGLLGLAFLLLYRSKPSSRSRNM